MIEQDLTSYTQGHQYDEEGNVAVKAQIERIKYYLKNTVDKSILELGLGNGKMVEELEKLFSDVTVLEGCPELILNYKEKHQHSIAKIKETCFEDFTTDEKYDVIHMGFVLEHVREPQKLISIYLTCLKPGGYMFISVPNAESLHRRVGYEAGLLDDVHILSETDRRVGHLRYYDMNMFVDDIETAINMVGFEQNGGGIIVEGIFLKPLMASQMKIIGLSDRIIDGFCKVGIQYPELSNSLFAVVRKEI